MQTKQLISHVRWADSANLFPSKVLCIDSDLKKDKKKKKKHLKWGYERFCESEEVFFHKICNGIVFKMCIKMLYGNTNNDAHVKMAVVKACLVHPDWRVSWSIIRKGDACLSPLRLQPGQCVKFQAAATMKRWQWAVNSNTRLQMLLQKKTHTVDSTDGTPCFFLLPNTLFWIWPLTCLKGRSYKKKKHEILCRV